MANVQPVVRLVVRAGVFRNPHYLADPDFVFVIMNDFIQKWTITDNRGLVFARKAVPGKRPLYNPQLDTYVNDPVDQSNIEKLISANEKKAPIQLTMSLTMQYKQFSKRLMDYLTREKNDEFNLADPEGNDGKAIAGEDDTGKNGTFRLTRQGSKEEFTYNDASQDIKDVPCILSAYNSKHNDLTFTLDLRTLQPLQRLDFMRAVMAAEHSKLLIEGALNAAGEQKQRVTRRSTNVAAFLVNFVDFDRAKNLFDKIIERAAKKSPMSVAPDLVRFVRDDIDRKMIAANHFAEDRENEPGEEYQQRMSHVIGSLKQTKPFASPVMSLRQISDLMEANMIKKRGGAALTDTDLMNITGDKACFALQFGLGHCQEHADISFMVFSKLIKDTPDARDKLKTVVLGGNANLDHEFTIVGLRPDRKELANVRLDNNFRQKKGGQIQVIDLKRLIDNNLPVNGYVCDAYLAKTVITGHLQQLLTRISDVKRKPRNTNYLAFDFVYPPDPAIPTDPAAPHDIDGI